MILSGHCQIGNIIVDSDSIAFIEKLNQHLFTIKRRIIREK